MNNQEKLEIIQNGTLEIIETEELLKVFDKDGNITTDDTGVPVYKQVPVMIQGILYTIGDSFKAFQNGGLSAFKADVFAFVADVDA